MKHLMIEIEAMDDKPTAAVTAIAAVFLILKLVRWVKHFIAVSVFMMR